MNKIEQMERRIAELEAKLDKVTTSPATTRPWNEVRQHILTEIDKLDLSDGDRYKLHTGITTIIRYSLGVKTVTNIPSEKISQARDIAETVIELVASSRKHLANGSKESA